MMLAPAEAQPSGAGPDPSRRTGGRGVSDVAASRRVVAVDALTGDDAGRHDGRRQDATADMAPRAALIERLARGNAENRAAAALW
jgi:hypothetical protein